MTTQVFTVTKDAWESFVDATCPNAFFQTWDWGETERRTGKTVIRVGFLERKKLVAVAQAVVVSARRGTFLHVRHGPILSFWRPQLAKDVIAGLLDIARMHNAVFIRVSPLLLKTDAHERIFSDIRMVASAIHAMDGEYCWVLPLDQSEEALLAGMRKTTRYEIRRAEKLGVQIRLSADPADISRFLTLYRKTSQRHGFVEHSGIKEEFQVFGESGNALLVSGWYEKQCISAALIIFSHHQAIYHHGASIPSPVPASTLVQWAAIREAKKRGMRVYNFWGIAPEGKGNHPWQGLTLFKKGFGGHDVSYVHAHDLPIHPWYIGIRFLEIVRKIKKGY